MIVNSASLNVVKAIIGQRFNKIFNPFFCTFIITWRCNAKCTMCDIWKISEHEEMSFEQISTAFSQLKNLDVIRITGGEPFLRQDLVEIVNMMQKEISPRTIHITTNGTLTEEIMRFIKSVDNPNNIHIKVSIDAIGDKHNKIRGVNGIYEKAIRTVNELASIKNEYGFYLGVNQTIIDDSFFDDMQELHRICNKLDVGLHQVLAYEEAPLYSKKKSHSSDTLAQIQLYGNFSNEKLKKVLEYMNTTADEIDDFIEKKIKKYYLKGLYNRLILNKLSPNPKCVALRNHIRILPNGDVPICLFKNKIVGNICENKFSSIWFGSRIQECRKEVDDCSGCWAGCEVIPNAIYSGDIVKSVLLDL